MKYYFLIILILISACVQKEVNNVKKNINLDNEMNVDKFIIKLKAYSDKNPYPDIKF